MKKIFPLFLLLALLSCVPALAEEAPDLTGQCKITVSSQSKRAAKMTDRDYLTGFISDKQKNASIEIAAPKGQPMYGVYVCFGGKLVPWVVEAKHGGKWVGVYQSEGEFAHEYAPLPEGETDVRIRLNADKQAVLTVSETGLGRRVELDVDLYRIVIYVGFDIRRRSAASQAQTLHSEFQIPDLAGRLLPPQRRHAWHHRRVVGGDARHEAHEVFQVDERIVGAYQPQHANVANLDFVPYSRLRLKALHDLALEVWVGSLVIFQLFHQPFLVAVVHHRMAVRVDLITAVGSHLVFGNNQRRYLNAHHACGADDLIGLVGFQ